MLVEPKVLLNFTIVCQMKSLIFGRQGLKRLDHTRAGFSRNSHYLIKSIFSRSLNLSLSVQYFQTPAIPLTTQGKLKTWLPMSAMAIGRFAFAVKMTSKN